MEMILRTFTTRTGGHKVQIQVETRGNFSFFSCPDFSDLAAVLVSLFSQFEEQLDLNVTHWETLRNENFSGVHVVFRHEPKEKVKVAHLPESEPDIGL